MGLDTVEFVLWAEKEFELDIPDQDITDILTVGQFSNYVHHQRLKTNGSAALPESIIYERIKLFLNNEFNVTLEKINRDSVFVKDLKLE